MSAISRSSQTLVIDSNVGIWTVLPALQSKDVDTPRRFRNWINEGANLVAPTWWPVECISGFRRAAYVGIITMAQAVVATEDLFALEVEMLPLDSALCKSALGWAERLQQSRAYDAFYIALAERLQVEFWTADKRLANATEQLGLNWVHWIGES